jgi:hypothetical protein
VQADIIPTLKNWRAWMSEKLIQALLAFLKAEFDCRVAPWHWSFEASEKYEELKDVLEKELEGGQ